MQNDINMNLTSSDITLKNRQNNIQLSEFLSEKNSMRLSKDNIGGIDPGFTVLFLLFSKNKFIFSIYYK